MKALWLSHFVPWPSTGHGALARSYHLVRETAHRTELHLVALAPPAHGDSALPDALTRAHEALSEYCASVALLPVWPGISRGGRALQVLRAWPSAESFWERWYYSREAHVTLERVLANVRPDVVHIDTVFLRRFAPLVRGPFALNHHNVESHLLERRVASAQGAGGLFLSNQAGKVLRAERELSARAATNVMVSQTDAERLTALVPSARTHVVANGVDLEFFRLAPVVESNARELVFLGGMDWFPNRDAVDWFVADLWPVLARQGIVERATIVGRAPTAALLRAAASDARLVAAGFVDDVRPHVARAAIFICPMRVGGGTRLKILDALAMGRVLISTALGVEGIPVVDGEHYLRAETPDDFARQIARVAGDAAMRARLGAAGRALVEREFGWRELGERLTNAWRDVAIPH